MKFGEVEIMNNIYKSNSTEYLLCLALDVGEGMLKNGGEVARVENTVERICKAYGAVHVEVFTIISAIHAAVRMPDGSYSSQMRRIHVTGNDFYKLELFNEVSRKICSTTPSLETFDEMIRNAKKHKGYPVWVKILASASVAAAFALFFGGQLVDTFIAAVVGAVIALIDIFTPSRTNAMAKVVISSFMAGLLSYGAERIGLGDNSGTVMMGAIMLLVPGTAFGTALRDLLCGDLLTGTLKTVQAVLSALMIAAGYMLSVAVFGGISL